MEEQAQAQAGKPRRYEDVERELAVCKLVLFNTFTADVLADLLKMYSALVQAAPEPEGATQLGLQPVQQQPSSSGVASGGVQVQLRDAEVQTESEGKKGSLRQDSISTTARAGEQLDWEQGSWEQGLPTSRWDLEFFSMDSEAEFGQWFNSWALLTDLVQTVLLCLLLMLGSQRLPPAVGADSNLPEVLRAALTGYVWIVLLVCCCAVYMPSCRMWYQCHREILVTVLRTVLAMFALPAGQLLWQAAPHLQAPLGRNICGSLAHLSLWAVPALTFRIRFSRHLFLQTAILGMAAAGMVYEVAVKAAFAKGQAGQQLQRQQMISGDAGLLRQLALMVVAGHLLPTGLVYLSELRVRTYLLRNALHPAVCEKGGKGQAEATSSGYQAYDSCCAPPKGYSPPMHNYNEPAIGPYEPAKGQGYGHQKSCCADEPW